MTNGIAKSFEKKDKIILVDIESHNTNLERIVESMEDGFVGNKKLLEKAASIHDLWKKEKLRIRAIIENKGSLFPGHGSEFPDFLVSKDFCEIEFDKETRVRNFDYYYILNLIRLHHSAFNTYMLYRRTNFIFEYSRDHYEVRENMVSFIKDWYGLKSADWIDSSILSNIFGAEDLERMMISEISLGQENQNTFVILTEGIFRDTSISLQYKFVEYDKRDLKNHTRKTLTEDFLSRLDENKPKKVILRAID